MTLNLPDGSMFSNDISGSGTINKTGSGTLSLTGADTGTGTIAVDAGVLEIGSNADPANAAVNVATGATLDVTAAPTAIRSLGGGGMVNIGTNAFTLNSASDTFSGTMLGASRPLLVVEQGEETLDGANLNGVSADTEENGQLNIQGSVTAGGLLGSGKIILASGSNLSISGNGNFSGNISGDGSIDFNQGLVLLSSVNSWGGSTTISANTVVQIEDTADHAANLSGTSALHNDGTLIYSNSENSSHISTLSAPIDGAGALFLSTGTFVIDSANSLTGANAGGVSLLAVLSTVKTGSEGLGKGPVELGQATLDLNQATDASVANAISDYADGYAGALIKDGAGLLTLTGENAYSGGTTINQGGLAAGTDTAFGTGTVTMADGTLVSFAADNLTLANNFVLNGDQTFKVDGAQSDTVSGAITDGGMSSDLVKTGTGTLTLTGENTYTGKTDIQGGTLVISGSSGSIAASSDVNVGSSATLDIETWHSIQSLSGAGNLAGTALSLSNASGTFSGTSTSPKLTILSGTETFDGAKLTGSSVDISGVTTQVVIGANGAKIGQVEDLDGGHENRLVLNGNLETNLYSGASSYIDSSISGGGGISVAYGGFILGGNNTYTGKTLVGKDVFFRSYDSDEYAANLGHTSDIVNDGRILFFNNADRSHETVISAPISGDGEIILVYGNAKIFGPNTLTGANYGGVSLAVSAGISLETTSTGLGSGEVDLFGSGILDINQTSDATISNLIAGNGDASGVVQKDGAGLITLSAANTYGGGTFINSGGLSPSNNQAFGTGAITMADGTEMSFATDGLSLSNGFNLNGSDIFDVASGVTDTIAGAIVDGSGAGKLVKTGGGALFLSGANTYTGGTEISAGNVGVGNNTSFGTGAVEMAEGTAVSFDADGLSLSNNFTLNGDPTFDVDGAQTDTISGIIADGESPGDLVKTGTGTLQLSGANTYTGVTDIQAGTLTLASTGRVSYSSSVNVGAGATLDVSSVPSGSDYIHSLNGGGVLNVGSNGAWLVTASGSFSGKVTGAGFVNVYTGQETLDGATVQGMFGSQFGADLIVSPLGASVGKMSIYGDLTLNGKLVLSSGEKGQFTSFFGANPIAGPGGIEIGSGTKSQNNRVSSSQPLTYTGETTIDRYAYLEVQDDGEHSATLSGTSSVHVDGELIISNDFDANNISTTLEAPLSGDGILLINGGETVISGANTLTGNNNPNGNGVSVEVDYGKLRASASGLGTGALLLLGSEFDLNQNSDAIASNVIEDGLSQSDPDDTGNLVKLGSGLATLTGANSYSGGTEIRQGGLGAGSNSAFGTGTVTMDAGTKVSFAEDGLTLANQFVLNGDPTFEVDGTQSDTVSGAITDGGTPGHLIKAGAGTLILTGTDTYTGGTDIQSGTLEVTNPAALGTGAVQNDATLVLAVSGDETIGNSFSGTGMISKTGVGKVTLTGAETGAGLISVATGTLALDVDTRMEGMSLAVADSATLDISSRPVWAASLSGAGTVNFGGSGLVLSNAAGTFSGKVDGPGELDVTGGAETLDGVQSDQLQIVAEGSGLLTLEGAVTGNGLYGDGKVLLSAGSSLTLKGPDGNGEFEGGMTGGGALTIEGQQTLVGTKGWTGGTDIAVGGTLISSDISEKDTAFTDKKSFIHNDGLLLIDGYQSPTFATLSASLHGNGAVGFLGVSGKIDGPNLLTGENNPYGMSFIAEGEGVAVVANSGGLGSGVVGLAGATLDLEQISDGSVSNVITDNNAALGAGAVIKGGSGLITMSGDNDYSGGTTINQGGLGAGTDTAFGTGAVTMAEGTEVAFAADGLTLANQFILNGDPTFEVDGAQSDTVSGAIADGGTPGDLVKTGTGTLSLTGTNSYTGTTEVAAGTLRVDGDSSAATGALTVDGGAALGGTGTVGGSVTVQSGATLTPGDAGAGTLTIGGSLTLADGATTQYDLGQPGVTGGAQNDLVEIGGDLHLGGTLNITADPSTGTALPAGVYRLFDYGGSLSGSED
ncbi:hypothetical protein AD930_10700, partial [Acetobacter malorum]